MQNYKTVEEYLDGHEEWRAELEFLRDLLNSTELQKTVKWGGPCYTIDGKNVVGLGAFKSYAGLWFFQGALLADKQNVLVNAQEGRTKALRQWRFESIDDIKVRTVKAYVKDAIELQKQGMEIKPDRKKPVVIPPELAAALKQNASAKASFGKLTKGKQREYADYISEAKRDATKQSRLEKILPMIVDGRGLNDKYRNC
ncbi:MAG: YdeI/OmpD-associated family protein [Planctomycetota bacterium]|nr:YdeI/OmpD-associated family protein [Planctomycetota bacterium]